jgi:FkbM family methyltransferase
LSASEAIWRLLADDELAVDVGANIGYMTGLMAARVGPRGQVIAFEPHPTLFEQLTNNVCSWRSDPRAGDITLHELALSDRGGTARLHTSDEFDANMGTATLRSADDRSAEAHRKPLDVAVAKLDDLVHRDVGLLKIDVEGHEHSVLVGTRGLLERGAIRDIVFEEHRPLPTPTTELLESHGYKLFRLEQRFAGVKLTPNPRGAAPQLWDAPAYLATNSPDRAVNLLRISGWAVLRSRR